MTETDYPEWRVEELGRKYGEDLRHDIPDDEDNDSGDDDERDS